LLISLTVIAQLPSQYMFTEQVNLRLVLTQDIPPIGRLFYSFDDFGNGIVGNTSKSPEKVEVCSVRLQYRFWLRWVSHRRHRISS
jgi:hypothetical protein